MAAGVSLAGRTVAKVVRMLKSYQVLQMSSASPPDKPLGKGQSFYRRVARSRPLRSATRRLGADAEPDLSPLGASDLVLLPPQGPPASASQTGPPRTPHLHAPLGGSPL